ncbi:MAG: hypothetical protein HY595_06175 [Candidatus Omnitrophica bacterium]|nr:hypothetical protein [Candidatus Omnitrophota bacterium]
MLRFRGEGNVRVLGQPEGLSLATAAGESAAAELLRAADAETGHQVFLQLKQARGWFARLEC